MKSYKSIRNFVSSAFMALKKTFVFRRLARVNAGRISMVENIKNLTNNLKR